MTDAARLSATVADLASSSPDDRASRDRSGSRLSDNYPTEQPQAPAPPRAPEVEGHRGRRRRPQSPGLKWHKNYSEIDRHCGRVLLIDFIKHDSTKGHMRKVAAQELYNLDALRRVYTNPDRNTNRDNAVLRVFHVQNAPWAVRFLLRKFNIHENRDDLVGTDFGRYVKNKRPERRGRNPFLGGRTWKVQHDPWRGVSTTSFGLDYLKEYRVCDPTEPPKLDDSEKLMELNYFDENDNPAYGYDAFVQRVSCYIQHKQVAPEVPDGADIKNPYENGENGDATHHNKPHEKHGYIPRLHTLDNGNAIIIFDNSHSGSIDDGLIGARQEWESRWRRLPFYLAFESRDPIDNDEQLAVQCSKALLDDVFKAVVARWDTFLELAMHHVSILEDKIYELPADETRAPELWHNSNIWLKVEKLMYVHIDVVNDMKVRLHELVDDVDAEDNWLENIPNDFNRLTRLVTEDLVKPTESLISLLYQSVSIRDSRHSLQLGVSMWRLSWVTFIFLPLTFISGFFGMNVDTFANDPSIKWYFIAAVPFMLCVLVMWYLLKHVFARQRQTPYQRGIYESFFQDMATTNPSLWSRTGPRDYVVPKGRLAKIKWHLIRSWSRPEKTIRANVAGDGGSHGDDDLGAVSKLKRWLIRRWTAQIKDENRHDEELALDDLDGSDIGTSLGAGVIEATELLTIPAAPAAEKLPTSSRLAVPGDQKSLPAGAQVVPLTAVVSRHRRSSSAGRSSGILVEEEDAGWLQQRAKEGKEWAWRSSASRERGEKEKEKDKENEKGRKSPEPSSSPSRPGADKENEAVGSTQRQSQIQSRSQTPEIREP